MWQPALPDERAHKIERIRLKIDPHQHVLRQVFSATLVDHNEFLVLLQIEAQSIQRGEGVEAGIDKAVAVFFNNDGSRAGGEIRISHGETTPSEKVRSLRRATRFASAA